MTDDVDDGDDDDDDDNDIILACVAVYNTEQRSEKHLNCFFSDYVSYETVHTN